jgi:hypothetical protein
LKAVSQTPTTVDYAFRFGRELRKRRRAAIETLIDAAHRRRGSVRILDLGGRKGYWSIFEDGYLASRKATITLLNPELTNSTAEESEGFVEMAGDACDIPAFANDAFDVVHSNSTIEHVGDWDRVEAFAREARRLAPSHYIQTPYFWFPVEPHVLLPVFHWLPEGVRAKIFVHTRLAAYGPCPDTGAAMRRVQFSRLLDRAQMTHLFPDAQIRFEWFGPVPKSLIAIRRQGA